MLRPKTSRTARNKKMQIAVAARRDPRPSRLLWTGRSLLGSGLRLSGCFFGLRLKN
jgi:hypothetical protein